MAALQHHMPPLAGTKQKYVLTASLVSVTCVFLGTPKLGGLGIAGEESV